MSEGIGSIGVSSTWQGSTLLSVVLPLLPSLVVASVTPAVVDEVLVSPLVEVSPLVDVEVPLALSIAAGVVLALAFAIGAAALAHNPFFEPTVRIQRERGHRVIDCDAVPEALVGADVVYATRVQRERMTEEVLVTANVSGNLLNKRLLAEADASDIIIMHPLPRDSRMDSFDLSSDVDDLPGLSIFRQTDNGVLIRMAIFLTTLGCSADAVKATIKQRPWDATLRWN